MSGSVRRQAYYIQSKALARRIDPFTTHSPRLDPGCDAAVADELRRRVLCNRWYTAGRQLAEQGRWREAAECFRRSLAWKRRFARAWLFLLASNLGVFRRTRAGGDSAPELRGPASAQRRGDTRPSNST